MIYNKRKQVLGKLALLTAALIWGTSFVVLKTTLDSVGPMWILAIRFTVSAVLLVSIAGSRIKTVSRRCLIGGILLGVFLSLAYILQTYGLMYTSPGKNAFLTATYCVLTPFLAWLAYKRKPGLSNVLAAFTCVFGIGLVSLSEGFSAMNKGDVLTLSCGVFYAAQIIVLEHYRDSGFAICISAVEFTACAAILLVGALLFDDFPTAVPTSAWLSIGYMSVMCTAVCFFLQAWGMKYTSSSTASMLLTLESVFGVLVSVLFYNEVVTLKMILGFALIFAAVLLSELRPFESKRRKAQ